MVKNELIIDAQTSDVGENTVNLDIKKSGQDTSININAKYITDILAVIQDKTVNIGFNGKLDPLLITPKSKDKKEIHIIMPLRS